MKTVIALLVLFLIALGAEMAPRAKEKAMNDVHSTDAPASSPATKVGPIGPK